MSSPQPLNADLVQVTNRGKSLAIISMELSDIPNEQQILEAVSKRREVQRHEDEENRVPGNFGLHMVESFDLSDNALERVNHKRLEPFTNLKTLILDNNRIEALVHDESDQLPQYLETIWLNKNSISDLEALLDVLSQMPALRYLSLIGNPCCPLSVGSSSSQSDASHLDHQHYRYWILYKLKQLKFLDMSQVTSEERKKAAHQGKFSQVVRIGPQGSTSSEPRRIQNNVQRPRRKVEGRSYLSYSKHVYKGEGSQGNRFINNDMI